MAITKISSGVISANAVTATIVAENVITSSEIATDGVGTLQIADDAVTSAKLDTNIDIAGTLDVTGVLTADSNVVIAGNLTVNGSTVTNSSTNTTIEDALIELGTGTTGTPANDAGIIIERGDSNNAFMGFDESADKFIVATTTATGASTGDLTLTAAPLVTGALTASGLSYPTSDGSSAQVLQTDGSGNLSFATVVTGGAVVHNYTATGDGSTVTFDTGINPQDEVNTWVHIDGVYQNKSEYSYNGSSITFSTAPDSGAAIDIISGTQSGFSTADSVLGVYSTTTTDTATYDTGLSASTENNVNIFIEGVYQPKSTYTWSGSTITFDANTPTGLALEVIASKTLTSGAVVTGSITDSAVTTAKIANNAITSAKIVNNSITGADISATTDIVANTFTGALTGNVTGNVTGNLTGTIQTAAQTNITSVGTLTGLTIEPTTATGLTYGADGTNSFINFEANSVAASVQLYAGQSSGGYFSIGAKDSGGTLAERMRVTSTGVGIGMTPNATTNFALDIQATSGGNALRLKGRSAGGNEGWLAWTDNSDNVEAAMYATSDNLIFANTTSYTERMRIDSSGNLLVGTSQNEANTDANDGGGTAAFFGMAVNRSSNYAVNISSRRAAPLVLNRMANEGTLIQFNQAGTEFGRIGITGTNDIMIYSTAGNHTGLRLGEGYYIPINKDGGIADNAVDLGLSSIRYKDLYLSGGAYLGGTGSANHLDDYEEGNHQTSISCASGSITLYSGYDTLSYTKVGRMVHVQGKLAVQSVSSPTGATTVSLPFAIADLTDRGEIADHIAVGYFNGSSIDTGYHNVLMTTAASTSYVRPFIMKPSTTAGNAPGTHNLGDGYMATGSDLYINFTYYTT